MLFQPVMPIPLYGEGQDQWRMITRPVIPFVFSSPEPTGLDESTITAESETSSCPCCWPHPTGSRGTSSSAGGRSSCFPPPRATRWGRSSGPRGRLSSSATRPRTPTFGVFPNYFWKIGSAGQDAGAPDVSQMSLLYFFNYKLPEAWQVGLNPTISYNDKASSGNRWNVPVGLFIGKTVRVGRLPVNIKVGGEYSVVSQDLFGQRFQFRFQITPVMPSLIGNPIFGR